MSVTVMKTTRPGALPFIAFYASDMDDAVRLVTNTKRDNVMNRRCTYTVDGKVV